MGVIKQLNDLMISQIAAGEVVASPSHVAKELVENAIDAGSTAITIVTRGAGQELISVTDNGSGIAADDLILAVSRHATSKLNDNDLVTIPYLGFRGEALAAIASVSQLQILSRQAGQREAWLVEVNGGKLSSPKPAAGNLGTTVNVRNLFFNAPARRKFLRSEKTENYRIRQTLKLLALANPQVSLKLIENSHQVFHYLASSLEQRVHEVMTKDFLTNALPVQACGDWIKLQGYISLPTFNRYDARQQFIFINQRAVTDRLISKAVRNAYFDVLASDKCPVYCLFLQVDHQQVDVNVHPGKEEVRFLHPQQVYNLVFSTLQQRLSGAKPQTSSTLTNQATKYLSQTNSNLQMPPRTQQVEPLNVSLGQHNKPQTASDDLHQQKLAASQINEIKATQMAPQPQLAGTPFGEAKAQIHNSYIIAENDEKLVLVDQHAAHERIVYEQFKKQLAAGKIASQLLLMPLTLHFSEQQDRDLLIAASQELEQIGFDLEAFGADCLILRQVPALISETSNWQAILSVVAQELGSFGSAKEEIKKRLERCLAEIACHSAIKSGQKLTLTEMQTLLDQLAATDNCSQCNHGRPTHVTLDRAQLAKLFQRR